MNPFVCAICGKPIDDPVPLHVEGINVYLHNRQKDDCLDHFLDVLIAQFKTQPEEIHF